MLTYLLITVLFVCFLHILFNYNYRARLFKKIPGPDGVFIFGNAVDVFLRPVEFFEYFRKLGQKWSTINKLWSFPYGIVNIYEPEDIEILIATTKFNQKNLFYGFLESWLQEGLLVSHGSKWHQRRKILTPAFHFQILKQFCTVFDENSRRLVEALRKSEGKPIDVSTVISEISLHTICETAMGTKLSEEKGASVEVYINAIRGIGHAFGQRCCKVYLFPHFMYYFSSIRKEEMKYSNIIYNFTKKVINHKIALRNKNSDLPEANDKIDDNSSITNAHKKKKTAFLDLLLSAQKDGLIDEQGIQEEVNTFMFEGHDTTSCGLTLFLMLLANNKHIQDKILYELNEIFGQSKRAATVDDFLKMRYLDRCIKESLRLYPPVAMIGRILSEETKLSGYRVPAGTQCVIQIYDLHRREDLYKDPLVFDPDRFLPENSEGRHPFAYIPFSAGPRNCIGQKFALLEMKFFVSSVIREFELQPITTPADLKFPLDLVLKSAVPVNVSFIPRNN